MDNLSYNLNQLYELEHIIRVYGMDPAKTGHTNEELLHEVQWLMSVIQDMIKGEVEGQDGEDISIYEPTETHQLGKWLEMIVENMNHCV